MSPLYLYNKSGMGTIGILSTFEALVNRQENNKQ